MNEEIKAVADRLIGLREIMDVSVEEAAGVCGISIEQYKKYETGTVDIPVVGIIAGAIVAGLAGCGVTYCKVVPDINKKRFIEAVKAFMDDLEQEMYKWVDGVIEFYNKQVEELKKTL